MPGTGSGRRAATAGRMRLLSAIVVAGLLSLGASALTAPAATAAPAARTAATGAQTTASGPGGAGPAVAPAVPASASFVARPQIAAGLPGVRQACATPTRPGQMACMALISTRTTAAVRADATASAPGGPSYDPAQLQDAYGLTTAGRHGREGETVAVVDAFNDPKASSEPGRLPGRLRTRRLRPGADRCLTIENEHGGTTDLPEADSSGWLGTRGITRPGYGLGNLP